LGIPLSDPIKEELRDIQAKLSEFCKLKSVESENIHITLKFIGKVADPTIKKMIETLEKIEFSKFKIKIRGIHVFPNMNVIKVFSLGIEPEGETVELNTKINQILETKEKREYIPHITLARIKYVKDKPGLIKFINENKSFSTQEFGASNFILYKSTLTEKGPIYEIVKKFDLK